MTREGLSPSPTLFEKFLSMASLMSQRVAIDSAVCALLPTSERAERQCGEKDSERDGKLCSETLRPIFQDSKRATLAHNNRAERTATPVNIQLDIRFNVCAATVAAAVALFLESK